MPSVAGCSGSTLPPAVVLLPAPAELPPPPPPPYSLLTLHHHAPPAARHARGDAAVAARPPPPPPVGKARVNPEEAAEEWREEAPDGRRRRGTGVRHYVTRTDTLVGISLKYGVSAIRRVNALFADDVCARQFLFIPDVDFSHQPVPSDPDAEKKAAVKRFQIISKCTDPYEAKAYVEGADFDINAALQQYWSDARWEKENPPLSSPSSSSRLRSKLRSLFRSNKNGHTKPPPATVDGLPKLLKR
ncbi:MAG: hypothetical protein BJ554DRAFT_25 [Olpidium bornovanus]|uniref:LysM domain-containing protein n=1 Tax=Olpidium bornovanus TaxID=278681 RepID=A0A8H8DIK2_9FUNG|nr:MAG: hypothetical protein BJ554DRAFT_25 [Olpidium bornovanus]